MTDKVHIHYTGTQIDGEEFDSSEPLGKPATFNVGGVIPGMTEALLMMPVGSKWRIVLPSDLAYKEQGAGSKIGPNATLIFEIELVGIEDAMPEDEAMNENRILPTCHVESQLPTLSFRAASDITE